MTLDALPPDVIEALNAGNKIEAIKLLRGHTGLGLKEAKDWVDHLERGGSAHVPEMPEKTRFATHAPNPTSAHARKGLGPGEVARGGGANKWLALAAFAALAVAGALFY